MGKMSDILIDLEEMWGQGFTPKQMVPKINQLHNTLLSEADVTMAIRDWNGIWAENILEHPDTK